MSLALRFSKEICLPHRGQDSNETSLVSCSAQTLRDAQIAYHA